MNECLYNVRSSLESLAEQKAKKKFIKCQIKIFKKDQLEEDDWTIFELREFQDNEHQGIPNLVYPQKNKNEIFDLSFANNYLVLISFSKDFTMGQVNNTDCNKELSIVGFLSSKEKTNLSEGPKVETFVNYSRIEQYFKKEWITCYLRPIEKIITSLR